MRKHLRRLSQLCDSLANSLSEQPRSVPAAASVEQWSQALIHARLAWRIADPRLHAVEQQPSLTFADTALEKVLRLACAREASECPEVSRALAEVDEIAAQLVTIHDGLEACPTNGAKIDFDEFLGLHDRRSRARWGVYFTPPEISQFVVREVDRLLVGEFGLPAGIADERVSILDPACGTGVFLLAVVDQLYRTFSLHGAEEDWNQFVAQNLLPRLYGKDVLLPACAVAWIRLAENLATTGYRFEATVSLGIELANAFEETKVPFAEQTPTVPVILGNPPFSALSTSGNAWIDGLLKASTLNGQTVGGYYEIDGQSLGEKKLWLHDDYVRFLRIAQNQIEAAGAGIVAFVTNHGYLDNVTFRGVRRSLLNSFSRITVLDLHGNRKKREVAPEGAPDENVFAIDQGVAISFLRKPPERFASDGNLLRGDLWGRRSDKLLTLQQATDSLAHERWTPTSPYYFFAPARSSSERAAEYARGFPLHEAMPSNSTAVVTARDAFVIAMSPQELLDRFAALCDESLSDDELRRRYFQHTRSQRYPRGDSRGWKLAAARGYARECRDPRSLLRRCAYRPFDNRWMLWADWLIDWPRSELTQHLLAGDNLALVARRQMPVDEPSNYFFVADAPVIDGLIRSDNRGSESFFPLFITAPVGYRVPNFSLPFWEVARATLPELTAEQLLFMIYAQFHSREFRLRFQAELSLAFPRVFVPRAAALFHELAELGRQLVDLHLLRGQPMPMQKHQRADATPLAKRGYPKYESGILHLSETETIDGVSLAAWEFRVGAHQVCRKWLRDRAGQPLAAEALDRYRHIVAAVEQTERLMDEVDRVIESHGGWPNAFHQNRTPRP